MTTLVLLLIAFSAASPLNFAIADEAALPGPPEAGAKSVEDTALVVSLEGQITDQMGVGHSDVSVTVYRRNSDTSRGDKLGESNTDRMGDFTIRTKERIRGPVLIVINKTGFAELTRHLDIDTDEEPPFHSDELIGNLILAGTVREVLNDRPVAKAEVNVRTSYRDWSTTTDDQGRFRIDDWSDAGGTLTVDAPGFGREVVTIEPDPSTDDTSKDADSRMARVRIRKRREEPTATVSETGEIVARLKPERIIHVKIVDDLDAPVARATVEFFDEPRGDFRTLLTDPTGAISLRNIHFDATAPRFRLTHPEYVSSEGFDQLISIATEQIESNHKLVMPRAGRVVGKVIDSATRRPLNGARAVVGTDTSETSPRDWSDDDGTFNILGVKPGQVVITLHLADYAPDLKLIDVTAGQATNVEFVLAPALVLNGVVKTKAGEPVAGAMVQAAKWRGQTTLGLRAMTNNEGKFAIAGAPSDDFEVVVMARGAAPTPITVKAGTSLVELTIEEAAPGERGGPTLKAGSALPEISLTALDGTTLKLPAKEPRVIVLDYWATWCGPCVGEIPNLLRIHEKFGPRKDFRLVSISLDDDEQALRSFIKDRKMNWTHVFGDTARAAAEKFGVTGIPAVLVLVDGKILGADLMGGELDSQLAKVFKGLAESAAADSK